MKKAIFGVTRNENQAQQVIDQLRSANLTVQDISILCPDQKGRNSNMNTNMNTQAGTKTHPGTSWSSQGEVVEEESYGRSPNTQRGNPNYQEKYGTTNSQNPTQRNFSKLGNLSSVNIPGAGSFLAAGPLKNSLTQHSTNATSLGALASTLVEFGITETEAKRFEDKLKKGYTLISFQSNETEELTHAKNIFTKIGLEDIATVELKAQKKAKV